MRNEHQNTRTPLPMWLEPLNHIAGPRLQLYCFPYGGAGIMIYKKWTAQLVPDIQLIGMQLPGRENRIKEPPFLQMKPLIRTLAHILAGKPEAPYLFFGHSLGALIAFELARELRRNGCPGPAGLVVSGCKAPHLQRYRNKINQLPDEEFIKAIRELGGTPEEVLQNDLLMQVFLPILRADFVLFENYEYEDAPPLDCPILAFGGSDDPDISRADLEAWGQHTKQSFRLEMFPGNHFYLETHYAALLDAIQQNLDGIIYR